MQPRGGAAPVFISGMNRVGRDIADALNEFKIDYAAIEADERLLSEAIADGYTVGYGNITDPKAWEPMDMHARKIVVLTDPDLEIAQDLRSIARERYPNLLPIALARDDAVAAAFESIGIQAVVAPPSASGRNAAVVVLRALEVDSAALDAYTQRHALRAPAPVAVAELA